MAEGVTRQLSDSLKCSVCRDTYTDPRILPCAHGHVFCQGCLEGLVVCDRQDRLSLTCPSCRQVVPIPASRTAGLQADFRTRFLLEMVGQLENEIAPIETLPPCDYCPVHGGREVQLFCEQCKDLICYKCVASDAKHYCHNYRDIGESFQRYKEAVTPFLEPMEEKIIALTKVMTEIDRHCGEISQHQTAIMAKILHCSKQMHEMINKRQNELIKQLDLITGRKLKNFAIQKEQVESLQVSLKGSLETAKKSLTIHFRNETLMAKSVMLEHVEEQAKPFVFTPVTEADMKFSGSLEAITMCQKYGTVWSPNSLDPSRCVATGRGVAMVGEKGTVDFNAASFKGEPYEAVSPSTMIEVDFVSEITGRNVECSTEHKGEGQYVISFQPTVKGRHQLHIKTDGQHIRGSPFSISVMLPVDKLSTSIQTWHNLGEPRGVALTRKREVVVAESASNCVSVFSPCGKKLRTLGTPGCDEGKLQSLIGVAVDGRGNILVVDQLNHCIQKFTADGHFLITVGSRGSGPLKFLQPSCIAYSASNGKVYVADWNHSVQILNSDLTFSNRFGREGNGSGQFDSACGVAVDSTGRVYVADSGNHRIQVFTADGKFVRMFGKQGAGRGELDWPRGIAVDGSGLVYVSEYNNHRVSVFTSEGEYVTSFTGGERKLNGPRGLAVDDSGVVYVCDSLDTCVQLF